MLIWFVFSILIQAEAQSACSSLLTGQLSKKVYGSPSPLSKADQQILEELARFRISIDSAQSQGSDLVYQTLAEDYESKQNEVLQAFVNKGLLSKEKFISLLDHEIIRQQNEMVSRAKQVKENYETQAKEVKRHSIDGSLAIFHEVSAGKFKMGYPEQPTTQIEATLTKSFSMMATPTTQIIWKSIVQLANLKFPGKYPLQADPSHFKGDTRPVEMVSHDDVQIWISALNELSLAGASELQQIVLEHKTGDVYRLPTSAEWEFVVRGRGIFKGTYFFDDKTALLDQYMWHESNSNKQTHPVGQKIPLSFEGLEFYDMYGNVFEWMLDGGLEHAPALTDPLGSLSGPFFYLRGGSWFTNGLLSRAADRHSDLSNVRSSYFGFRLVKESNPQKIGKGSP